MSGHSKWAKLKHFKGAIDAKRAAMFTKVSRMIAIASREGGPDPRMNFKLRLAIEKAKQINMPKANIQKAIDRGQGKTKESEIESGLYEVSLFGKVFLIIEALTDNKNRTIAELRRILSKYNANIVKPNSILWMFDQKGVLRIENFKDKIKDPEEFQLKLIDCGGVEDIKEEGNTLVILTKPDSLEKIKNFLEEELKIEADYSEVEWFAKNLVEISPEEQKKIDSLYAELDEHPDVNDYYSNIK